MGGGRLEAKRAGAPRARHARPAGGGVAAVSQITGLARSTIGRGLKDLDAPFPADGRVRREGGGPRPLTDRDASLLADLERLVEPVTRGDPERPLLWASKSCDKLATALCDTGHAVSPQHRTQAAHPAGVLAPSQPQGGRRLATPQPQRPVRAHRQKLLAAQGVGEPVISV